MYRKLKVVMMYNNISRRYPGKREIQGLLFCLLMISIVSAQNMNPREVIPLDSGWRFWLGDDPSAREPGFDDTKWRSVDLPHDWTIESPVNPPPFGESNGGYFFHGIAWYRKSFA